MGTIAERARGPLSSAGIWPWMKRNLFSSWLNTLLTLASLAFLVFAIRGILLWALYRANWEPVIGNLKLYAVGQYPPEQVWRIWLVVLMVWLIWGASWGAWGGISRTFAIIQAAGLGAIGLAPVGMENISLQARLWLLANPAVVGLGYLLGRRVLLNRRWIAVGWLLVLVLSAVLVTGIGGSQALPVVDSGLWGGLLLTFVLALVGIVASFPIGVLLALGRRSNLPLVKLLCIGFIEIVRGVPLVTILFMASILLPLFLPTGIRVDRVLRAMIGITLFSAAYMAENVRGGLAAVPAGQYEAGKAVGLSGYQIMLLIVLPQALRAVIPAIVGQFIALFMDTTLAIIVGLLELLAIGRIIIQSNPQYLRNQAEVFLFIAVVFWVFTYSMSYASRRLETALGVGKR